ncbi:winged helix-turn-helix transcriptional regulator [Nanoarchaeota archaeon]
MNTQCTVFKTADYIGKRWTLVILLELYKGKGSLRYSDIKNRIPDITPKLLSARLKELEHHSIISKKVDARQVPIRCDYALTPAGHDFIKIIKDIKKWSLKHNIRNKYCDSQDCNKCEF